MTEADTAPPKGKQSTVHFTYHDPGRTFDGTPYEASGKAVTQVLNLLKLLRRAILDTGIQVRNAYMQRNLDTQGEPNAEGWESAPEKKIITGFVETIDAMQKKLTALHRATTYDPSKPPKE